MTRKFLGNGNKTITTMAKMIRHDFGAIHDALNKMIVAEVKAALELLPEKCIREEGHTLCRIVIGSDCEYSPRNVAVDEVWVDEKDGLLHIYGRDLTFDQNWVDNVEPDEWTEEADLYDISDFEYLIDQIAAKVPDDGKPYHLAHESILTAGYVTELSLKQAVEKLVTV